MQIVDNWLNFNAFNEIDLQCVKHRECRVLESCLLPLHVTKSAVKHPKISLNNQKKKTPGSDKKPKSNEKINLHSCLFFLSALYSIQNSIDYWIFFL